MVLKFRGSADGQMNTIIDRRDTYKDRSSGSRRRFIDRHKDSIRESIERSVRESKGITDIVGGDGKKKEVRIKRKGVDEPHFVHGDGGQIERVLPGNDIYNTGDTIDKPYQGGASNRGASRDGDGEDEFSFFLNRDEYLNLLFEGLELPDLVKKNLIHALIRELQHDGFTPFGAPGQMDVVRSFRNSLGRRIGLGRRELTDEIEELEAKLEILNLQAPTPELALEIEKLEARLERLKGKKRAIPFLDLMDMRYRHKDWVTYPTTSAVMFCLMDVSGSMTERHKTIAKYFFLLLHLFLTRQYERVQLVFIRHTHEAKEVTEEEFFHSRESGGTIVMSALEECHRIIRERYDTSTWNIYIAQASDGDSFDDDAKQCQQFLQERLLPLSQYMVYVQIDDARSSYSSTDANGEPNNQLWNAYKQLMDGKNGFDMGWIGDEKQIYPVFRKLFAKKAA